MTHVNDLFRDIAKDQPKTNVVQEITLHSVTVLNVYPNGAVYVDKQKSYSWIQGKKEKTSTKKKQPKKAQFKVEDADSGSIFDL